MNELALFAGAGGGILGGKLLGWRTVCAVEIEPYAASVLLARQNDGILPPFPIWDDVQTFDGKPWRGIVDVVSGGFPCQDISSAGKGAGITGERSGLWKEFARTIGEVRPRYAFVENSPMLTSRGLGTVLGDLAEMGYDAEWGMFHGGQTGLSIKRERIWILASSNKIGRDAPREGKIHIQFEGKTPLEREAATDRKDNIHLLRGWYTDEVLAETFRTSDDMAEWMGELEAIGNGQVPILAALAWRTLNA
jgi:DNA (cytosine-5)-methyltransferase 1